MRSAPGDGLPATLSGQRSRASRRITEEHRLVCPPMDDEVVILQARYHYE
ncbi:type II toxin-antitoxin system YoeB family toxin [Nonomuraea wenchangensis]